MVKIKLGILAEDTTDCETIDVLARRLLAGKAEYRKPSYRSGDGSATLVVKAVRWMKDLDLAEEKCTAVILIHDLDSIDVKKEAQLRNKLEAFKVPDGMKYFACIPVQEIEAWFLSDSELLRNKVLKKDSKKKYNQTKDLYSSPELVKNPKEELITLSKKTNKQACYSTNKNPELAKLLHLDTCAARCKSFRKLKEFLESLYSK